MRERAEGFCAERKRKSSRLSEVDVTLCEYLSDDGWWNQTKLKAEPDLPNTSSLLWIRLFFQRINIPAFSFLNFSSFHNYFFVLDLIQLLKCYRPTIIKIDLSNQIF